MNKANNDLFDAIINNLSHSDWTEWWSIVEITTFGMTISADEGQIIIQLVESSNDKNKSVSMVVGSCRIYNYDIPVDVHEKLYKMMVECKDRAGNFMVREATVYLNTTILDEES